MGPKGPPIPCLRMVARRPVLYSQRQKDGWPLLPTQRDGWPLLPQSSGVSPLPPRKDFPCGPLGQSRSVSSRACSSPRRPQEIPAKSKIVAVDLFKNGLAIVKREVALGKPGIYVLDDVPNPVHGTFYIDSAAGWRRW